MTDARLWSAGHPLWQAGFRPFFPLAALAGAVLPLAWVAMLWGLLPPLGAHGGLVWHAHEMFFGFGLAVLYGFLLTASKNWTGTRGYTGGALIALAAAWLAGRLAMLGDLPAPLFWPLVLAFPAAGAAMLVATLLKHRERDGFARDNRYFILALPLFSLAEILMLSADGYASGREMALALLRLCLFLMLERVLPAFMMAGLQTQLKRDARLDHAIKALGLCLVAAPLWPAMLQAALAGLLGVLLLIRFVQWEGFAAFRRLDLAVMYVGYLAIALQLLVAAADSIAPQPWTGAFGMHLFALGGLGAIVPAMFIRISNGHTGRRIVFGPWEQGILALTLIALIQRVALPQLWPAAYLPLLTGAAVSWSVLFGIWLVRYLPQLMQPRTDGRVG